MGWRRNLNVDNQSQGEQGGRHESALRSQLANGTGSAFPLARAMDGTSVRNHNERLVLSLLRNSNGLARSEIARLTTFSPQTASVIIRGLESDGLVTTGHPVRGSGKVGKPVQPVRLNPDGAFALGMNIGRRGTDLILTDFAGTVRDSLSIEYRYPTADIIHQFARSGVPEIIDRLSPQSRQRVVGIGVAIPFQIWEWLDIVDASPEVMGAWRDYVFEDRFREFTDLPVMTANDASMACCGELLFGRGRDWKNFAYFFVGFFIGGGLAINGKVFLGNTGNAAAFGTLPVGQVGVGRHQLINHASLYLLEHELSQVAGTEIALKNNPRAWQEHETIVEEWMLATANWIAKASVAVASVVDVERIVIDGEFPEDIRHRLTRQIDQVIDGVDMTGIARPVIASGSLGPTAGAIGAAYQPILEEFLIEGSGHAS